ncbi:hypothetical protein O3P69_005848 [Scylla paramamosain]|uniref:Derlin n=1 Tax=Scylla paramamosain TaxID=85552 RepID=A0AAW0U6W5_SCYPA
MGDVGQWFSSLPPMTKYWFGGTLSFSLIGRFGLISGKWLTLQYSPLFHSFQLWRPFTSLFFYPITPNTGLHFLIMIYALYKYSLKLETGHFARNPADYLFMLLFTWMCCLILGLIGGMTTLMDPMVMSVLYVWCQLNKDVIISFWFGFRFKAMYLPYVLVVFNFTFFYGGFMMLLGIIVGHLYYFLTIRYPQDFGGATLLHTPEILYKLFPDQQGVSGFGQAPTAPRPAAGGATGGWGGGQRGIFRGQGHTLN